MKEEKTYFYEMKTIPVNVIGILIIIPFIIIAVLVRSGDIKADLEMIFDSKYALLFALLIPYLILHELLHSLAYVLNGAKFKNITYGAHLEKGILCCSCKQLITKKNILWSLMYPFLFIGIVTFIIGLIFHLPILVTLSIFNISGCGGDLAMFIAFLKIKNFKFFEYDNPMAFGIVTSENLDNKKLFGLKQIKEDKVVQTIDKKVTISKTSIIIFIIVLILILIDFL